MRFSLLLVACAAAFLGACTPTYNWREVRFAEPGLVALLPCKPDQGTRNVALAGRPAAISMQGCEADGATFAIAWADVGEPGRTGETLAQWTAVTLSNMRATEPTSEPFTPPGAIPGAGSVSIVANGSAPDGKAVQTRAVWFARGSHVFHAVVYAPRVTDEMAQTFFSALKLQ